MLQLQSLRQEATSSVRHFEVRAELYGSDSALLSTYKSCDDIISIKIERLGDAERFFGYGVFQKLNIHLKDKNREKSFSTDQYFQIYFDTKTTESTFSAFPKFYITETHRNENTNELSITAYDVLYKAKRLTVADMPEWQDKTTIEGYIMGGANCLGNTHLTVLIDDFCKGLSYPEGANLEETTTIKELFDDIAEITGTIYYIDGYGNITFKKLTSSDVNTQYQLSIPKSQYFTLKTGNNRKLTAIAHITELGDNISSTTGVAGTTQYLRDNAFINLRNDASDILNNIRDNIGNFTIGQFDMKWRGNPSLEIGDRLTITTKDNELVHSYLLDDVVEYDGVYKQSTKWQYEDSDNTESETQPTTVSDIIKQTSAKVDKINQKIELVVSSVEENTSKMTSYIQEVGSIKQLVEETQTKANSTDEEIEKITKKLETVATTDSVKYTISQELENGVDKVTTATGFTFDENGLTVSKTDQEMKTTITENGMTVYKDNDDVLVANNEGVKAVNLYASTYLIIGNNSRFEDYESSRAGCFWIGG